MYALLILVASFFFSCTAEEFISHMATPCIGDDSFVHLDFSNAAVIRSNLGYLGGQPSLMHDGSPTTQLPPDIVIGPVGTYEGQPFSALSSLDPRTLPWLLSPPSPRRLTAHASLTQASSTVLADLRIENRSEFQTNSASQSGLKLQSDEDCHWGFAEWLCQHEARMFVA